MSELMTSILELLEQDARYSATQLAAMLGETKEAVQAAIAQMEQDKILLKYTTIVDYERAGIAQEMVSALIEVRIAPQRDTGYDAIANRIARFDEVKTMYLMSGAYDVMIILDGRSIREISQFVASRLSTVEGVLGTATHFILKKYKDQGTRFEIERPDKRLQVSP